MDFEANRQVVDATYDLVCAYKPNTAFYEARGAAGWADLKRIIDYIRLKNPLIPIIADAKRADIGTTNEGYVAAFFDDLGCDGVTVNPYLGREALKPFLERGDKGIIVLCKTSNEGSGEFQNLLVGGRQLWEIVADTVAHTWNENHNCLLVAGATYPHELEKIRQIVGDEMWLLIPGVGAQGGDVGQAVRAASNSRGTGMIINSSRAIISSPDPRKATALLRAEIQKHIKAYNS